MTILRSLALTALAGLMLAAAPAVGADGWGYDLADELMSPYCPGRALSECPSPQAEDLRRWILDQASAGRSRAEVEAELYGEWGDTLRQAPRAEGVGLVAYLIPVAVILAGAVLVAVFLRRQVATSPLPAEAAAPHLAPVDADLERQLDEELRNRTEESW